MAGDKDGGDAQADGFGGYKVIAHKVLHRHLLVLPKLSNGFPTTPFTALFQH